MNTSPFEIISNTTKRQRYSISQAQHLPFEILSLIFQFLDIHDLFATSQTCKHWNMASSMKHIWKNQVLKFHQDFIVQISLKSPSDRLSLAAMFHPSACFWILATTKTHLKVRLTWPLPSDRFLASNEALSGRISCIQSLDLSTVGDQITDFFFRDLIKQLPILKSVNISSCFKIGNKSIYELVKMESRRNSLEDISLRRCFGLSFPSIVFISQYCRNLKSLDLSDGSGVVDEIGLLCLLNKIQFKMASVKKVENMEGIVSYQDFDLSDLMDNKSKRKYKKGSMVYYHSDRISTGICAVSPLMKTLKRLRLSGADYVDAAAFQRFFTRLSNIGLDNCQLETIDISHNFNVTDDVLSAIFHPVYQTNSDNNTEDEIIRGKRKLEINVRCCDQLTRENVDIMKKRLETLKRTGYAKSISQISIESNCKLYDHSEDSIRHYIQSIVG